MKAQRTASTLALGNRYVLVRPSRLLHGQRRRTEVRLVFIFELSPAPVGAVIGSVGVDPGDDPDKFAAGKIRFAGVVANPPDQLTEVRSEVQRR